MAGLIEIIEMGCLDESQSVSSLLRKMKVAAAKLNLHPLAAWINNELVGYDDEVPEYRKIWGEPKVFNPYRGWIDISGPSEFIRNISLAPINNSIPSIESSLKDKENKFFYFPYNPEMVERINEGADIKLPRMGVHLNITSIEALCARVRDLILEWSLDMHKAGVRGDGLDFSPKEVEAAVATNMTVNNHINIGSIGGSVGALGVGKLSGDIRLDNIDLKALSALIAELRQNESALLAAGVNIEEVKDALDTIEAATNSPEEKAGILKGSLIKLKDSLLVASGSAMIQGVVTALRTIMGA
ncbi:AbiTii domain-containing protein [Labrys sp. 22185]|uniref:AbiTii domain-containing protein n=1 Tax=Labrys sp. 22185 TaxID=3453888 RepID=UPI003F844AAB